jgi:integrase/recombinase XerD
VQAFLNGSRGISSSWHLKHYTLAGLFRFALQRGLVSASPLPGRVPQAAGLRDAVHLFHGRAAAAAGRDGGAGRQASHRARGGKHTRADLPDAAPAPLGAGLRLSEALALSVEDVDLTAHLLVVRATKFFKSRLLPIGPQLPRR